MYRNIVLYGNRQSILAPEMLDIFLPELDQFVRVNNQVAAGVIGRFRGAGSHLSDFVDQVCINRNRDGIGDDQDRQKYRKKLAEC